MGELVSLSDALRESLNNGNMPVKKSYRFDIFKGVRDESGKVTRLRSVGAAHLTEGTKTYSVYLKTFLKDVFFLLPEEKKLTAGDYVILTREPSKTAGRKYHWNNVGECSILGGSNSGLMKMRWDLLGVDDIYMSLHPICRDGEAENSKSA